MVNLTRKYVAILHVASTLLAFTIVFTCEAKAANQIWPTSYLRIIWNDQAKPINLRGDPEVLGKSCGAVGAALGPGKGPWGFGLFPKFGCFTNGRLIGGAEGSSAWILMVEEGDKVTDFSLMVDPGSVGAPGDAQSQLGEVGRLRLPSSPWLVEFVHDPEFVNLLALALLVRLPVVAMFEDPHAILSGGYLKVGSDAVGGLKTPARLQLFKAKVGNSWVLEEQAPALLESTEEGEVWHFSDATTPLPGNGTMILAKPIGPGAPEYTRIVSALSKRYKTLLQNRKSSFKAGQSLKDSLLRQSTASGYVGLRFAKSLVSRRDDLLVGAKMMGVLTELRSGPMKGFRLYYDSIPRVSKDLQGQQFFYESSHLIAGYGFIFEPNILLDRIDIAPKIGGWRLSARLPLINEIGGIEILDFSAANRFSFGVEARGEMIRYGWVATGWVAQDITAGRLTKRLGQSAVSQRIGFDGFAPGIKLGHERDHINLSFLGFWYREDTRMDIEVPSGFVVRTIASYGGAGISIAW